MSSLPQLRHRPAQGPSDHAFYNDSNDLLTLRAACGTFGVACIGVLFCAFFLQMGIALLKLYARPAEHSTVVHKPAPMTPCVRHLGIIMDGNRRYGKRHMGTAKEPDAAVLEALRLELCSAESPVAAAEVRQSSWWSTRYSTFMKLIEHTTFDGHRTGGEKLLEMLSHCIDAQINMVTVYAFSTDNWQRPTAEVDALMALFFFFFDRIRQVALEKHIFVRFISTDPEQLPRRVLELMRRVEEESRRVTPRRLVLNICVSYSGQSEIIGACNRILARRLCSDASLMAAPVTKAEMHSEMLRSITQADHEEEDRDVFANGVSPEPELILRTSGEQRVSNFLLYECAYSELAFVEKTWPEFTRQDLFQALANYASRDKRMGR